VRGAAAKLVSSLLVMAVIFAVAEPVLPRSASALTQEEMERILEGEGEIRHSPPDILDIIDDIPFLDEIARVMEGIVSGITAAFTEFTTGDVIGDIITGFVGSISDMITMIPSAISSAISNIPEALGKIVENIPDAVGKFIELLFNIFEDPVGWIMDTISALTEGVELSNPPLAALWDVGDLSLEGITSGVFIERVLTQADAVAVEIPTLLINFGIAEVIWLACKYLGGTIGDQIGPWWADCLAYVGINLEDTLINGIKAEEQAVLDVWYETFQENYAHDHNALADGQKIPLTMPGKLSGLYSGLAGSGAASFASNPSGAFSAIGYEYRTGDPERFHIDDYEKRTRDTLKYSEGFAAAAGSEAGDITALKNSIRKLGEAASNADGYRKAHEARNRILIFAAQEAVNMRLDVARRIDMSNRMASDWEQRRADSRAAFERSVGTWATSSIGAGGY
jgi:hypothetical protein